MASFGFPSRPSLFSRTLRECRELYVDSGELVARDYPEQLPPREPTGEAFIELMDDLHRALVLKVYLTVVEADRKWSKDERFHAEVLCQHLWGEWLDREALKTTIKRASAESGKFKWRALLNPFAQIEALRGRVGEVETLVSRLANLVARCDGDLNQAERLALKSIEQEIAQHLKPLPIDGDTREAEADPNAGEPPASPYKKEAEPAPSIYDSVRKRKPLRNPPARKPTKREKPPSAAEKPSLEGALAELDRLIGLSGIKHEVRSLTNFLRLQQRRQEQGLPETDISLHLVFTGNPGTGKTTVARIVGKIYGALGVLEKGHLIETDRSGLVAEYAGQTGPKTNKKIDEALDGVLFLDEAYSLVARESDDPYGREAAQALLKRAEDDRERLVVVLAGYPDEMDTLLRSNPGLSSRFNRRMAFDDYTPVELCRIFGLMCEKNHYRVASAARLKVMLGMHALHGGRDRHFGNGRAARNLFEHAVRRMANRLADQVEATEADLMTLTGDDIEFPSLAAAVFESLDESAVRVRLSCGACEHSNEAPTSFLGQSVKCPKCGRRFAADWGELLPIEQRDDAS